MVSGKNMEVNVLIVGAGPAGSTMSLFLSRQNIPHMIIDKAVFPRDKICGDALSGKVMDVMKLLDPKMPEEIASQSAQFTESYGVKFASPNGKFIDIPFKKDLSSLALPPGFISRRMDFDNFLFQKIDKNTAAVFENCSLKSLVHKREGIECILEKGEEEIRVRAQIVVSAEGDRSIIAKTFSGIQKEDNHYCAGLRAYYKGITGFHEKNFIELHFLKELLPGYLWIFPLPDGNANVGVGMLSKEVSKRKVNLKKVMLHAIENNPTISHRFANAKMDGEIRGWGLPLGSKKRSISGDRFLLLGDAASLIDPFTGEGIGNAMMSGMIAARHAGRALNAKRFDKEFMQDYDAEIYHALWSELKLSHTLQKLSKYGWLFNYVVSKAERNEALRDTITSMFDDLQIRDKLRSPKFYLKLVFGK